MKSLFSVFAHTAFCCTMSTAAVTFSKDVSSNYVMTVSADLRITTGLSADPMNWLDFYDCFSSPQDFNRLGDLSPGVKPIQLLDPEGNLRYETGNSLYISGTRMRLMFSGFDVNYMPAYFPGDSLILKSGVYTFSTTSFAPETDLVPERVLIGTGKGGEYSDSNIAAVTVPEPSVLSLILLPLGCLLVRMRRNNSEESGERKSRHPQEGQVGNASETA